MSNARIISGDSGRTQAFKNRIINGDMRIDQRNAGASATITAASSAYTLDRWKAYGTGANFTVQRVAGSGSYQYATRITGASSNNLIQYYTRIESLNCYDLAGQTVTLSCTLKASTNTTCIVYFDYANSSDNFAATTNITNSTFNITTTATQFTTTFTVPSAATTGLQVLFAFNSGLGSGLTVDITGVQLEKGSTATSFDYRPYGTELQLCQRYYQQIGSGFYGATEGTSTFNLQVPYWQQMRTSATVAGISGRIFSCRYAGDTNITNPTLANIASGNENVWLQVVSSGLTSGVPIYGRSQNIGSSNFLSASAEL